MNKLYEYALGYFCCICTKPIKDSEISDECKEKISRQLTWHEDCKK